MRPIDAEKLKSHYAWWDNEEQRTFDQIVDSQPTVETVAHGEWRTGRYSSDCYCSVCRCAVDLLDGGWKSNYCPNCGAKMDGR